jgi:hypothetical protein
VIEIDRIIDLLKQIGDIGRIIDRVTDCSFIYWHRSLLTVYFDSLIDHLNEPNRISVSMEINPGINYFQYFFDAINDSCHIVAATRHTSSNDALCNYRQEIYQMLETVSIELLY